MTAIINADEIDAYVEVTITFLVKETDKRFAKLHSAWMNGEDVFVIRNGVRFNGKVNSASITADPDSNERPTLNDPGSVIGQFGFVGRMKE